MAASEIYTHPNNPSGYLSNEVYQSIEWTLVASAPFEERGLAVALIIHRKYLAFLLAKADSLHLAAFMRTADRSI